MNEMGRKLALITGAARGIGYGIAEALASEGFDLVINDIIEVSEIEDKIQALRDRGVRVSYVQADVSDRGDRERIVEAINDYGHSLTTLVNNAGVAPITREDIMMASEESYERVMKINLQGPYFLTQAIANLMTKQATEGFRCIVNIGSSNSLAASVNRGEYCISQAGLSMASKLWAVRLAEFGIPVYEIRPGLIETYMTRVSKAKYDPMIEDGFLKALNGLTTIEEVLRVAQD